MHGEVRGYVRNAINPFDGFSEGIVVGHIRHLYQGEVWAKERKHPVIFSGIADSPPNSKSSIDQMSYSNSSNIAICAGNKHESSHRYSWHDCREIVDKWTDSDRSDRSASSRVLKEIDHAPGKLEELTWA